MNSSAFAERFPGEAAILAIIGSLRFFDDQLTKAIYMNIMFNSLQSGESLVTRAETLLEIKKAEEEAEQIVREAQEKHKAMIAAARREAARRLKESEEELRVEFEAAVAREKSRIASQKEEILRRGREEAEKVKKMAAERIPQVKTYLKNAFERAIDVSARANG